MAASRTSRFRRVQVEEGYGTFSIGWRQVESVNSYFRSQERLHEQKKAFDSEYVELLLISATSGIEQSSPITMLTAKTPQDHRYQQS